MQSDLRRSSSGGIVRSFQPRRSRLTRPCNSAVHGRIAAATLVCGSVLLVSCGRDTAYGPPEDVAQQVSDWGDFTQSGHRFGGTEASLAVVAFLSPQCPWARAYATTLDSLRAAIGEGVIAVIVHVVPTLDTALTRRVVNDMECAARAGGSIEHALTGAPGGYSSSICADSAAIDAAMRETRQLGQAHDIHITPATVVDGWRLLVTPTATELTSLVHQASSGPRTLNWRALRRADHT